MTTPVITDLRIRRITAALAFGILVGLLFYLAIGERKNSSFERGDFPAFYAAADIVWTGRGNELYNLSLQREVENRHWPDLAGRFYIFPYPPFFALVLSPLASLPPLTAKAIASAFLLLSLVTALFASRKVSPFFQRHFLFSLFYLLTLAPLGGAIVGVQNTALSLLCFCLIFRAAQSGRPILTGLGSSMLLYKPQFGAPFSLFLIRRANRKELLGFALGALLLYLLGTMVLGLSWPLVWLRSALHFGDINFTINGHNMISLAGLTYWGFEHFLGAGAAALPWAYLLSATLMLFAVRYVGADDKRLVLTIYLVLFLSPQTLFYDTGIAAFFFIRDLQPNNTKDFTYLALLWLYCAIAATLRDQISFPLFSVPLVALFWLRFRKLNGTIQDPL